MFVVYFVNTMMFLQNNVCPLVSPHPISPAAPRFPSIFLSPLFAIDRSTTDIHVGLNFDTDGARSAPQVTYTESAISYSVSLSCVLGSRLCLNVRGMIWSDDDIDVTGTHSRTPVAFRGQGRSWPVHVASERAQGLSQFEMDELRSMRPGDYK